MLFGFNWALFFLKQCWLGGVSRAHAVEKSRLLSVSTGCSFEAPPGLVLSRLRIHFFTSYHELKSEASNKLYILWGPTLMKRSLKSWASTGRSFLRRPVVWCFFSPWAGPWDFWGPTATREARSASLTSVSRPGTFWAHRKGRACVCVCVCVFLLGGGVLFVLRGCFFLFIFCIKKHEMK